MCAQYCEDFDSIDIFGFIDLLAAIFQVQYQQEKIKASPDLLMIPLSSIGKKCTGLGKKLSR